MSASEKFEQQPLTSHLAELRSCLMISLAAVLVAFVLLSTVTEELSAWFLKPLLRMLPRQQSLIFTSYQTEFFFT